MTAGDGNGTGVEHFGGAGCGGGIGGSGVAVGTLADEGGICRLPVLVPWWGDAEELSLQLAGVYWRQPFWKREEPNFWLLDLGLTPAGRRQVALLTKQWGELPLCRPEQLPGLLAALGLEKGEPIEKAGRNRLLLFRTGVERKNRLPGLGKKAPDSPILVGETCRNVG